MTDTNHHVLTGKVDITSNLLVGSSHLFVDTNNNRVGLVTANPDAGLHVNSNAYVNADLRVGPAGVNQVVINATAGHVKAGSFEGDGSLLQNTPPGADGAAATIAVGTTTPGPVGTTTASVTNSGTSSAAVFDFVIPRGEQGIQGNPGNDGADGADGSNGADGADGAPGTDGADGADGAGYWSKDTNDHLTYDPDTGVVGQTTIFPNGGIFTKRNDTGAMFQANCDELGTDQYNYILNAPRPGTNTGGATHFINGSTRPGPDFSQEASKYVIRNDNGILQIGHPSHNTEVYSPNLNVIGGLYDTKFKLKNGGTICREYTTGAGDLGAGLHFTENAFFPTDKDGNLSNGVVNLGSESNRFNSLWARDSVYVSDYHEHGGSNFFGKRHTAINGILAGMEIENTTLGGNYSQKVHLRSHHYGVSHGRRLTVTENGNVGLGTESPSYKLHVSAGNDSITFYGPNSSWGGYLAVGAANNKTSWASSVTAQCISTNGNLHLDAGYNRDIYMNYYNGTYIRHHGSGVYSDDRLKSEEELITNATDTLLKLSPQKYLKRRTLREDEHRDPIIETGLMAQDVWYDAPELRHLVHLGADANPVDTKPVAPIDGDIQQDPDYSSWGPNEASVNYDGLIAYLIKSNQEIHEELQSEKNKVATMELLVASLVKRVGDLENLVI